MVECPPETVHRLYILKLIIGELNCVCKKFIFMRSYNYDGG